MSKVIVVVALASEAPELITFSNVRLTGLGKVNAARSTTEIILREQPDLIVNFGTAGGITVNSGLHPVASVVQRDMNCSGLGVEPGVTPFDAIDSKITLNSHGVVCGTGDNFVAGRPVEIPCDIVDMEAYAIARVCQYYGVKFRCWKWISDSADDGAGSTWTESVHSGEQHFLKIYQQIQQENINELR